jgi:2-hydroxy-3-oxopropionate reductase
LERLGFIGLGIMGRPMARNLLRAGFTLTVHSRSAPPVEELEREGAAAADSPAAVAGASDIVVTMLPDTPDVEQVLFGDAGVAQGARDGALVVDMSTIDPEATRRFASKLGERGVAMLDAPVSGGEAGAVEGTLAIMVGGTDASFERVLPVLQVMGKQVVHIGSSGAGQVTKACNQLIAGATVEAVAEALVLAAKAGVDPAKVREALLGGFAGSRILEVHGRRMLDGDFEPGFKARLHRKDAGIVLDTARRLGVPVPSFAAVADALERLVESGGGDLDHSALVTLLEGESGASLRPPGRS